MSSVFKGAKPNSHCSKNKRILSITGNQCRPTTMIRRMFYLGFRPIYQFNQWFTRRFTLAGLTVLGGMIAAGVIGVDTRQNMAHQLFAIFAGLLLVAMLNGLRFRPRLLSERQLPPYATVGQPVRYTIAIRNRGRRTERDLQLADELKRVWPSFVTLHRSGSPAWRDYNRFDRYIGYTRWLWLISRCRGGDLDPIALPAIPPRGQVQVSMTFTPIRRGYVEFEQIRLGRPDPLGLFFAFAPHKIPGRLLVLPQRYPIPPLQLPGSRQYQRGGVNLAQSIGNQDEFVGLRDYRPGDPLKLMHWRSVAKRGKPVVKELQDEYYTRHALILDTFVDPAHAQTESIFETAVSVAASLASADHGPDALLDLMFVGLTAYHFTAGRGVGQVEQLLTTLACVQPCTQRPFCDIEPVVLEHAAELSACICILLAWDEQRRTLVDRLRAHEVPVWVLLIGDDASVPAGHPIHPDHIAEDLAAWRL